MNHIPFWKMSGSGNDFIMIDNRDGALKKNIGAMPVSEWVSKVCRRGLSVGADGVILVEHSAKADYLWHYYNADGGEVAMCGNGSRCVARFAYLNKIAPARHTIETLAGIIRADVSGKEGDRVRVQLTDPTDLRLHLKIEIDGVIHEGHFVNTGVPHVVYFVDDLEKVDLVGLGRATRYHSLFAPAGTNANFVALIDRHTIKIRTYERGVEDETLACGTGSVAAAIIATALEKTTPSISVQTQGGTVLGVDFKDGYKEVFLEGDARIIYKGELLEEALL
jgi:diaminopimelate epimerase